MRSPKNGSHNPQVFRTVRCVSGWIEEAQGIHARNAERPREFEWFDHLKSQPWWLFLTIFWPIFLPKLEKLGKTKNIHQRLITSLLGEVYHQRFIKSNRDSKNRSMNIKVPTKHNSADSGVSKNIFDQLAKTSKITKDYLLGGGQRN